MRPIGVLTGLMMVCTAGAAHAQDVDKFDFSPGVLDGGGGVQIPTVHKNEPGAWYAGAGVVLSNDPLVLRLGNGDEEALVGQVFSARLLTGVTVPGNIRIELQAPYYPSIEIGGNPASGPGDIQASTTVPLPIDGPISLALRPQFSVPTAAPDLYISDGFSGGLLVLASGDADPLIWQSEIGTVLGSPTCLEGDGPDCSGGVWLGRELIGGFGLGYPVSPRATVGAEMITHVGIAGGEASFTKNPTDMHLYALFGDGSGLMASVAGGTGVVAGVGAPDWRLSFSIGWRDPGTPPDSDGDGVLNINDQCPDEPEDIDNFKDEDGCPDDDNDNDGVPDRKDRCPDKKEDLDGADDSDGCPEYDNDGDRVLDVDDACPNKYGAPQAKGCPDRDKDGVPDSTDQCLRTFGTKQNNGCPEDTE
ncbi:MAG: hypothetical protein VX519_08955 [Myxococcota bacterium]|nr:hypothetical protein [Myxococcota bacterium]